MAEYYAVLSRAVAGLSNNAAETRRAVYDKARNALIGQLKAINPPLPATEISRQRLELEEAIRRVEREVQTGVLQPRAAPAPPRPRPTVQDGMEPPAGDPSRRTPQDIFRRAITDAEARGSRAAPPGAPRRDEPPPMDIGEDESDEAAEASGLEPHDVPPPPQPAPGRGFRETVRPAGEPRLAPDYDFDRDADQTPRAARVVPEVTGGERGAGDGSRRVRLGPAPPDETMGAGGGRRGRRARGELGAMEQRARPSRLPALMLFGLIVVMAVGLAAFGWSQRGTIGDILASLDGTHGTATVATTPAATPADTSGKNADRLLPGDAPDRNVRVVGSGGTVPATTPGGSAVAVATPSDAAPTGNPAVSGPVVATVQKATLYEEPLDPAAAQSGVIAFSGTVAWSYRDGGQRGPEVVGQIDIPDRKLKITVTVSRNGDASLPASHLFELAVSTPADFPGKGVQSIPSIVLKTSEEARGDPLIGAAATVSTDVYWIALANGERELAANLALLRDRGWLDIRLVYQTGQRAILTIQKGTAGEQAFTRAFTAWQTG